MNENQEINKNPDDRDKFLKRALLILIILTVLVVLITLITYIRPAADPQPTLQPTQAPLSNTPTINPARRTPRPTRSLDPVEENVGYANGIIILSGVLCLIVLIAGLREIAHHRSQSKNSHKQSGRDHDSA
jgi:hypothetical protein